MAGETFPNLPTSQVLPIKGQPEACTANCHMVTPRKRTWHISKFGSEMLTFWCGNVDWIMAVSKLCVPFSCVFSHKALRTCTELLCIDKGSANKL